MNENNSNKRRVVLALILVATITISILATTAYFITQGRVVEERLTVKTGTLALTFEDNDDGVNEQLMLGETVSKEFIIRNTGNQPVTTNMLFDSLVNTYLEESLSYRLEYKTSETGDWTSVTTTSHTHVPYSPNVGTYNLAEDLTIPASGVYYYRLTIKFESLDINQEKDREARLTTKFRLGDEVIEPVLSASETTLARMGLKSQGAKDSFDTIATTDETTTGLYSLADDYGTSYYFRGTVTNNYMKFGGFYWRIIRINGDGSVRMIYDGTKAHTNGETGDENDRFIQTGVAYNASYNDNAYVGWMYGTPGSSTYAATHTVTKSSTEAPIKKNVVDPWYKTNIADKGLGTYVSDEIFCNDRSMPGTSGWSSDTGLGYGTNATAYGAVGRLVDVSTGAWLPKTNQQPKFTCTNKNDAFTVSDTTKGNGSLSYPAGLITADEIVAAGSKYYMSDGSSDNTSYYLYRNKWYWSLSPNDYDGNASVFGVDASGVLYGSYVSITGGAVAPVINISADYAKTLVGNGTMASPYQIPGVE